MRREEIKNAKRIVIKVGTSTLTHSNGLLNLVRMDRLVLIISELMNQGKEIVLVSSGAIGVGTGKLNLTKKPDTLGLKQAVAAVGQCELMNIYSNMFSHYNRIVAQILLTKYALDDEKKVNNVMNTFTNLLDKGILPIVNENDTVSTDEIESMDTFGDNDTLSSIVAKIIKADALIILSDIDGFYDEDPRRNPNSKLIHTVTEITSNVMQCAGDKGTDRGCGGMITKLQAAKISIGADVNMVIANGEDPNIILDILEGKLIGTLFCRNKQM